jgi:transposase-like protein
MPKRYGKEFRRAICTRLVAGERISKVASETGVSPATLHRWNSTI